MFEDQHNANDRTVLLTGKQSENTIILPKNHCPPG